MVPNNRATDEATKATPTTIPTVQEKVRPDPVPTISSTDIATTATYVEQRQEPRELGVL
jgi:hypothetical protein